jgi:hypothetical protein
MASDPPCLQPGKVLYLNVQFPHETEAHDKYLVLAGMTVRPLLLKINTADKQSKRSEILKEFQFRLRQTDYPGFLHYDSYLNCGAVWDFLTTKEVVDQWTADPKRLVGEILRPHQDEIINLTRQSKSISSMHKDAIAKALQR